MTTTTGLYHPPHGPALAYTLHLPPSTSTPTSSSSYSKLALIAHPYGRLGGSQQDHLVVSLARFLAEKQGYAVLRYDARGSGKSEGSGSWSSLPEAQDYQALLHSVLLPLASASSSGSSEAAPAPTPIHLLLAGYSAGSLSATYCPSPSLLSPRGQKIHTQRLLISYPLSVSWALSLFRSNVFDTALRRVVESGEDVMVVWGDGDQFTAVGRYRSWSEELEKVGSAKVGEGEVDARRSSKWRSVEIQGADHFWVKRESKERLLKEVSEWVRSVEANSRSLVESRTAEE